MQSSTLTLAVGGLASFCLGYYIRANLAESDTYSVPYKPEQKKEEEEKKEAEDTSSEDDEDEDYDPSSSDSDDEDYKMVNHSPPFPDSSASCSANGFKDAKRKNRSPMRPRNLRCLQESR
jgi:hypothetical protein